MLPAIDVFLHCLNRFVISSSPKLARGQTLSYIYEMLWLRRKTCILCVAWLAALVLIGWTRCAWAAGTATTTLLSLTSGGAVATSAPQGTVITLTATVEAGTVAVHPGLVRFCDATAKHCEDSALLATVELNAAGAATYKFRPGAGSHSYYAAFVGTTANADSNSANASITVNPSGKYVTATTMYSSGSAGKYALTATVTGTGSATLSPTGSISFLNTTNNNATLGTAPLTASGSLENLTAQASSSVAQDTVAIATGDFNGDGIEDIVTASGTNPNEVTVLLGNGDGTFTAKASFTAGDYGLSAIAVGDFNGDGVQDLVVLNNDQGDAPGSATILIGNGDGTFTIGASSPAGLGPISVVVADLNGDGILDLAVASGNDDDVHILIGEGDGTFSAGTDVSLGNQPLSIVAADLNGDGIQDLIVNESGVRTLSVLLGRGDGTFTVQSSPAFDSSPSPIVVGDFNGDGIPDVAAAVPIYNSGERNPGVIQVLLGNGDGTFMQVMTSNTGTIVVSLAAGDFNGDGITDLEYTDYFGDVAVLSGKGDGSFGFGASINVSNTDDQTFGALGDFNGDGLLDIAMVVQHSTNVVIVNNIVGSTATATGNIAVTGLQNAAVEASYAGDVNYSGSASTTLSLAPEPSPTSLVLTSSHNPSVLGDSVTLTAALSPYSTGSNTTDGETIAFAIDGVAQGTGTLSSGVATLTTTAIPVGTYALTASYAGDASFSASTSNAVSETVTLPAGSNVQNYVVTTTGDTTTGVAANCVSGSTNCSLRDALAAAAAAGAGTITFSSTVFSSAQTITLVNGTLIVPSTTSITGPVSGGTQLVTVNANGQATVFYIPSNVFGVSISGLIITGGQDGNTNYTGGGVSNLGGLTMNDCMVTANQSGYGSGGGIYNGGTMTLANSVISSNMADEASLNTTGGGGVWNAGTMSITATTISGNSAAADSSGGGGVLNSGTLTMINSVVSGNSITQNNPLETVPVGAGILNGGMLTLTDSTVSGNTNVMGSGGGLAGSNASTTIVTNDIIADNVASGTSNYDGNQPLLEDDCAANICSVKDGNVTGAGGSGLYPGSPAICAGLLTNIPAGVTTDIRGAQRTTMYSSSAGSVTCVDAGAYQTHYAVHFSTEPPASVAQNAPFNAALQLTENGSPSASLAKLSVSLAAGDPGMLLNNTGPMNGNAIVNFPSLIATAPGMGDTLFETVPVTTVPPPPSLTAPLSISAISTAFDVTASNYVTATIGAIPAGITFTVDGESYSAPVIVGGWANGSSHTIATTTPQTLNHETYVFSSWSDGGALSHPVVAGSASSYTATFTLSGSVVVNTNADDATGTASNCTAGSQTPCALRDALANATAQGQGTITFDPTVFAATQPVSARTITLTGGALSVGTNTTINGPTTGATQIPLVTVSGNNQSTVFTVSGSNNAITGLIITGGNDSSGSGGGGVFTSSGSLTIANSTVTGNTSAGSGGGIYFSQGYLNITNSYISNNTAQSTGGGIENVSYGGSLTITNSTVAGNSSGIDTFLGTVTITNSTVSGNIGGGISASGFVDGQGDLLYVTVNISNSTITGNGKFGLWGGEGYNSVNLGMANSLVAGNAGGNDCSTFSTGCPSTGSNGNIVGGTPALAQLANYGGPTPTMPPLPGSSAICAGIVSSLPSTDQRGVPRTTTYGSNPACVDVGAVQTKYAVAFSTQPPATVGVNQNFTAAVQVNESGQPFPVAGIAVPLTLGQGSTGTLSGNSASTGSNGIATYSSLQMSAEGSGDTLVATLPITTSPPPSPLTTAISVNATSNSFSVGEDSQTITFTPLTSPVIYGVGPITLSATASSGLPVTFSVLSGPGTINGNSLTIMNVGTVVVAANQAGNATYAAAPQLTQSVVVTKGALTVTANNATRVYGTANPSFSGSVTGAVDGDTFTESFTTAATMTSNAGKYPIVPVVTGANVADYSVTTVSGALTVTQAASSAAITSSSSTANPGTPITFTATITSSTTGMPTGSVQFLNGATVLGASTLNNQGVATLMTSALPSGTDAVQAVYAGDENFSGSTASITETIATPGFSLSANPTQLTIVAGQSGKATITLTPVGGYMGTETFSCSGLPQYSTCTFQPASLIADGSNTPVTTTMTIATNVANSNTMASLERKSPSGKTLRLASIAGLPALFVGLMLVCTRRRAAPWIYRSFCAALMMAGLAAVVALQGCGGGSNGGGSSSGNGVSTPIGTSTVKMSASAGGASQAIDITVVITH